MESYMYNQAFESKLFNWVSDVLNVIGKSDIYHAYVHKEGQTPVRTFSKSLCVNHNIIV